MIVIPNFHRVVVAWEAGEAGLHVYRNGSHE